MITQRQGGDRSGQPRYSLSNNLRKPLLFLLLFGLGAYLIAAMEGQLDIIMAPWYTNPLNTWEFPLPLIFNRVISALEGWETIDGLIDLGAILMSISAFCLGFYLANLYTRKEI